MSIQTVHFTQDDVLFPHCFHKAVLAGHTVITKPLINSDNLRCLDKVLAKAAEDMRSMVISPDGKKLFCSYSDGNVRLYEGEKVRTIFKQRWPTNALALSPNGATLLFGDGNKLVFWDVEKEGKKKEVNLEMPMQVCLAVTDSGEYVSGSISGKIVTSSGIALPEGHVHFGMEMIALSEDGQKVVSCYSDHSVQVIDLSTGSLLYRQFDLVANALVIAPHFIVMGVKENVVLMDVEKSVIIGKFKKFGSEVLTLGISQDGKSIVACSDDEEMRVWRCIESA